jgi:TPR repeat protein
VAMTAYAKAVSGAEAGKAMHWYDKAAAMGEVMAIFDLGLMAYRGPDSASAEPLFHDGAKRGFPPAMFMLARMVGKEDPAQAHQLWAQADARGHVWSTLSLAREAHERRTLPGSRIETDYLWRAMELGSGDAAYELGSHAWPPSQRRKLWGKAQQLGVDLAAQPPLPSFSDRLKLRWLSGRGQPR